MIDQLYQHHFCNAIVLELKDQGGGANCRDVIEALKGPKWFDLTSEEMALTDPCGSNTFDHSCHAAAQYLRKHAYLDRHVQRGVWRLTTKPYGTIDKGY